MSHQYTNLDYTKLDKGNENKINYQVNNFSQPFTENFTNDYQIKCNTISNCLYNAQGLLLCHVLKKKT